MTDNVPPVAGLADAPPHAETLILDALRRGYMDQWETPLDDYGKRILHELLRQLRGAGQTIAPPSVPRPADAVRPPSDTYVQLAKTPLLELVDDLAAYVRSSKGEGLGDESIECGLFHHFGALLVDAYLAHVPTPDLTEAQYEQLAENRRRASVEAQEDAAKLLTALEEIAKGNGRFSRDNYEFACNVIDEARKTAIAAIAAFRSTRSGLADGDRE